MVRWFSHELHVFTSRLAGVTGGPGPFILVVSLTTAVLNDTSLRQLGSGSLVLVSSLFHLRPTPKRRLVAAYVEFCSGASDALWLVCSTSFVPGFVPPGRRRVLEAAKDSLVTACAGVRARSAFKIGLLPEVAVRARGLFVTRTSTGGSTRATSCLSAAQCTPSTHVVVSNFMAASSDTNPVADARERPPPLSLAAKPPEVPSLAFA